MANLKARKGSWKRVYGKNYAYVNTKTGTTFNKQGFKVGKIKLRKKK